MQTIRFSHRYEKMPDKINEKETLLLEVLQSSKKELSDNFIRYDTGYCEKSFFEDDELNFKQYSLPDGKLIILILITYCGEFTKPFLWTTCRRWTAKKEQYYRALRGQQIRIEIKEQV